MYSKVNNHVKNNQKSPQNLQTPAAYTCSKDRCKYNLLEGFRCQKTFFPQEKKEEKSCKFKPTEYLLKTETFILLFASAI